MSGLGWKGLSPPPGKAGLSPGPGSAPAPGTRGSARRAGAAPPLLPGSLLPLLPR